MILLTELELDAEKMHEDQINFIINASQIIEPGTLYCILSKKCAVITIFNKYTSTAMFWQIKSITVVG